RFGGVAPTQPCAPYVGFAAPPVPPLPAPVLNVTLVRRGGVLGRRGVGLTVRCDRPCRITGRAILMPQVGHARTALSAVPRQLQAGVATPVRLRLAPRGLRLMRTALGEHRRGLRALVTVTAISVGAGPGTPASPFVANYHVSR
ncbi:MAG: hypothetical protein LC713_07750, partial [Actinobacteria bacterium]|nr:hypothetical protein [Actinomycetota bacterium]